MKNSPEKFYERLGRPIGVFSLDRRWQDVLYDKKWKKFAKMSRAFNHLPFVDFVLAAGSMALGNVHEKSDFDVLVGCRYGRIFTARFFCVLAFGFLGRRRKKFHFSANPSHHQDASDKICFNHFVTKKSFCLSPPYNMYWRELYRSLVPIYGNHKPVNDFFRANHWIGPVDYLDDRRHFSGAVSSLKKVSEKILEGRFGNAVEFVLRAAQIRRIENNLRFEKLGFEPRIRYNDEELEFHPDTARIAKMVEGI